MLRKTLTMVNMTNISTVLETNERPSVQGALSQEEHRALSFTAVLVLTSLFAFFTLSITGAIIVFCKKKNSVFALQKCEQESDIDYELDDHNSTEIEMSDDEDDDQIESGTRRSATYPDLKIICNRNYRPHSVRDVGKYENENQEAAEIPRAHTFSFEKYEYTPIALNVPKTDKSNNRTNRVKKKHSGYHKLQMVDKDSIELHGTSLGELQCNEDSKSTLLYSSQKETKLKNFELTIEDSESIDEAKLLQHPH